MKKTSIILFCIILAVFAVSGCSSYNKGYDESTSDAKGGVAAPQAPQEAPVPAPAEEGEYDYGKDGGLTGPGKGSNSADNFGGHKIILTYELSIETDRFDEDLEFIMQQVEAFGGYAQSSSVSGRKPVTYRDNGRYANLSLRIPSDKVGEFVNSAKGVGTLLSSNDYAQDISAQYFDRETRLNVLRVQLERLKSILVETDNLADIIELEKEIARVTIEIEELTSELRRWDNLVDYATVSIYLDELSPVEGPADELTVGERISRGFTSTLTGVGVFFENLFVFLISASPVLVILGAITAVVLLLVRRSNKKKAAKRADNDTKNNQ